MLYPNGLNKSNGSLYIKGYKTFDSAQSGFFICFKNSDIEHSGIPGTDEDRLSVEITIQRTLVSSNQLNASNCNGRHLKEPWLIYKMIDNNLTSRES